MAAERILIVEDDVDNRAILKRLLDYSDYRTMTAANGRDGLELARKHLPDLILLDLRLPYMDGALVAAHLKGERQTRHIPLLLLTASSLSSIQDSLRPGLVDGILQKPFDMISLLSEVERLLRSQRANARVDFTGSALHRTFGEPFDPKNGSFLCVQHCL